MGGGGIIKSVFVNFTSNIFEKNKRIERDELKNNFRISIDIMKDA